MITPTFYDMEKISQNISKIHDQFFMKKIAVEMLVPKTCISSQYVGSHKTC